MKKKLTTAFGFLACSAVAVAAFAEDVTVSGIGKAPITPDIALTRSESLRAAKRNAIVSAITKLNGSTAANDPKVQAAVDQMAVQIGDDKILDQTNSRDAANNFVTRVTLRLDELDLRKLVQDMGIASTVARNYPVLIVMDEFFTTPANLKKPLREVVEYSHDKTETLDASHSSSDSASSASSSSSSGSYSGSATYAAGGSSSGTIAVDGNYAHGQRSGYAAGSAREKASASSAASSHSTAQSSTDEKLFAQKKDVVNFKKLVEYQPQGMPEKNNYTYTALVREANKFDLQLIDNDVFRSRYFTGKPLTMEEMQNNGELARYVDAARDNKADYFMVGNTVIVDNGPNAATGTYVCDGMVTLKAYATEDSAVLATDARSESASGNSPDQCRTNVANKLATLVGSTLGSTIQNYWRQREEYGREYNIHLVSALGKLTDDERDAFAEALEKMDGLMSKVIDRKSTPYDYEVSLTYKGSKGISREIGSALRKVAMFKQAQRKINGTTVKVCLEGACPER